MTAIPSHHLPHAHLPAPARAYARRTDRRRADAEKRLAAMSLLALLGTMGALYTGIRVGTAFHTRVADDVHFIMRVVP